MSPSEPTVVARFAESLERSPGATAVRLVLHGGEVQDLSYKDLHDTARRAARGLASLGLGKGDVVLLLLPTCREMLGLYLACLYTGVIPLIQPEPRAVQTTDLYAEHVQQLAAQVGARFVLTLPDALDLLDRGEADLEPLAANTRPEDVAHLQATSGSTGMPKIAVLRNRNVSANVRAIGEAIQEREGDTVVSWLPLYHDMGLICISCNLYWQRPLVLTDPANFVRHPIQYWLQLISSFGGTVSPAPTSAYQVCARLARRRRFEGLDLSRWRVAFCGAEPVHPRTLADFYDAFAPYGLPATTLLPVYGLAESTLAVTIPPQGARHRLDVMDGGAHPITLVCVGRPLAGHQVRVTDAEGNPLPERQIGEIEALGPSVVDGYWKVEDTDGLKRPDGYLRTGDLGYLDSGELFVTGRKKDILILRGRNLVPSQLEALVEEVLASGIQNGVAAVGLMNDDIATEELHLIVESRVAPPPDREELEEKIRNALSETFEVTGIYVHWLRKGSIPKTTSGKIRRSQCREIAREQIALARPA